MNSEKLKELRHKVDNLREEITEAFDDFGVDYSGDHLHWFVRNNVIDCFFSASSNIHALWATEVEREKQDENV